MEIPFLPTSDPVDVVTQEETVYGPTSQIAEPDLIAMEVTRVMMFSFENSLAEMLAFPVRTFGA